MDVSGSSSAYHGDHPKLPCNLRILVAVLQAVVEKADGSHSCEARRPVPGKEQRFTPRHQDPCRPCNGFMESFLFNPFKWRGNLLSGGETWVNIFDICMNPKQSIGILFSEQSLKLCVPRGCRGPWGLGDHLWAFMSVCVVHASIKWQLLEILFGKIASLIWRS